MRGITFLIVATALALSACAPKAPAEPTISSDQIQASAMAVANTMIAETQAAIPTPTEVPPTPLPSPTPMPSPTLLALPTLALVVAPTSGAPAPASTAAGGDPCKGLLSSNPAGPLTTFKIVNANKAPIVVSLGLTQKTKFGECGYRSYSLGPMDSVYLTDLPQGCYWAFAFVNNPKKPSQASLPGAVCPNNDDKWTFVVQAEVIKFYSP